MKYPSSMTMIGIGIIYGVASVFVGLLWPPFEPIDTRNTVIFWVGISISVAGAISVFVDKRRHSEYYQSI